MFYSGIDQHKRDSFITTYDDGGAIVNQERIPNTPLRIQRYFAQFPGPHKAVVESTGSWYWLADLLQHLNVELSLAHATRLKAISAAKVKTDKVDSDILALLLRADLIPEAHMICPERRAPRDLMRTRLRLVEKGASCKNSIATQTHQNRPHTRRARDHSHRLSSTHNRQQLQRMLQKQTVEPNETVAVAAPGKPTRLTGSASRGASVLDWEARRCAKDVSGTAATP